MFLKNLTPASFLGILPLANGSWQAAGQAARRAQKTPGWGGVLSRVEKHMPGRFLWQKLPEPVNGTSFGFREYIKTEGLVASGEI
ncbi:MAG: hypothetical protein UX94_C0005G0043 [Parcubacteria group bacterium GW2011_GWA2_47_21]|nr:MAG: hypothetical protein UX94_C0005G0043 [Parcubacteria group bacterium GW2011_GWA2_47_21]